MIIFPVYSTLRAASQLSIDFVDILTPINSRYVIQWVLCSYLYLTALKRSVVKINLKTTIKQRNRTTNLPFNVCCLLPRLNFATSPVCVSSLKRNTIRNHKTSKRKCLAKQYKLIDDHGKPFDFI